MRYFEALEIEKDKLIIELIKRKVDKKHLAFNTSAKNSSHPRVPTDSNSQFLANRAMGDWAERILSEAITQNFTNKKVVQYGETNSTAAGDEGFKEFFLKRYEDVNHYGKRPDLLVMPKSVDCCDDVSDIPTNELFDLVKKADFSIEVRSSKFEAQKYMNYRNNEYEETGKKPSQMTPNFTVKVEDLLIVYKWISLHSISQIYCQVFFDSIYAMNFLDIFKTIASGKGFKIVTPEKSQLKSTIMIPITTGKKIADFREMPKFTAETRITKLGRHDAYVVPTGGKVVLSAKELLSVASFAV